LFDGRHIILQDKKAGLVANIPKRPYSGTLFIVELTAIIHRGNSLETKQFTDIGKDIQSLRGDFSLFSGKKLEIIANKYPIRWVPGTEIIRYVRGSSLLEFCGM
jgi:hypothetical protein